MSFITKRRLASLASASALIATIAVAAAPSAALASPTNSSGGSGRDGYNAIPSKVSGNVPSYGFEAYSINELGDYVRLGGTTRKLSSMSVVFSSWACQSGKWGAGGNCVTMPGATFPVEVTFNIYDYTNGVKGDLLATETSAVDMAYRPSASPNSAEGKWYNSKDKTYYNGFPQTVTMPMTTLSGAPLPEEVIWTVQYSTSHFGPKPGLSHAAADSLNIGTKTFAPEAFAGTDLDEDQFFVNSTYIVGTGHTGERPLGAIVTK
jgi:hypothetical protein